MSFDLSALELPIPRDTVSRIANESQVLIVKRKVDFSRSFSSASRTEGANQRDVAVPGSPPAVRRVSLTPAPSKQQVWVNNYI